MQGDKVEFKSGRGGKREGAGRPVGTDKKIRSIRLSDTEYDKVRKYVKNLRDEEIMAKNWEKEMQLDVELSESEKEKFVQEIVTAGVPSIEEYAESIGKDRDEVEEEYMDKYGEAIRTARDAACE